MREIQNLKEDWRCALIGDGVLLGMKDGLKQTLKFSATAMVMMPLVLPYYINSSHIIILWLIFLFTEESEVRSIPQSLSKPVHIHNVVCQPTALTLDKCSHERYSGNGNDVTDVIIICQNGTFGS